MRIAVLSDCRLPSLPDGAHGLGRSAHDIARGLALRKHDVTLYAGEGSEFINGVLICHADEESRAYEMAKQDGAPYDAILDTSHLHTLSKLKPYWPIVNRIADRECKWQPPNAVVNSDYMQRWYRKAMKVPTGIELETIPFQEKHGDYLLFMSAAHDHKGYPAAKAIADAAKKPIQVLAGMKGADKWHIINHAFALLHPSEIDAAPRSPLEAAAAGVPTICLDRDGSTEHVAHCITGFVCRDVKEMLEAVEDVPMLDRKLCREWVGAHHSYARMIEGYEGMLKLVTEGKRW
jgi:hypothetical protein